MAKTPSTKRVVLEFSPEAFDTLKELRETTGAKSFAEVVQRVLGLAKYINSQMKQGKRVIIKGNWWKPDKLIVKI